MVFVAIYTGLRVSELAGLRWNDVHENGITIDERFCRGDWGAPKSDASNATIAVNPCVVERIHRLKLLTVEVRAGHAVRKYRVVKSHGPDDLVFQSVKDGKPIRDNNILTRFIKPAARTMGLPWVKLAVSADLARSLAQAGRRRRKGRSRSDAPLTCEHDVGHLPAVRSRVTAEGRSKAKQPEQAGQLGIVEPIGAKTRRDDVAKCLQNVVARDGVEPPTPAFSGLRYAVVSTI